MLIRCRGYAFHLLAAPIDFPRLDGGQGPGPRVRGGGGGGKSGGGVGGRVGGEQVGGGPGWGWEEAEWEVGGAGQGRQGRTS